MRESSAVPPGHPAHTFRQENRALEGELALLDKLFATIDHLPPEADAAEIMAQVRVRMNALSDVEKHYQRKENLLFPFLEKHEITGPPTVLWGKHDETRELMKGVIETLQSMSDITAEEARTVTDSVIRPASKSISEMIYKEEEILLPMSLDTLTETEWLDIYNQSLSIGQSDTTHPSRGRYMRSDLLFPTQKCR